MSNVSANSLRFRISCIIICICILVAVILGTCYICSARMIRTQVYATCTTVLNTYVDMLDANLNDIEAFLASLITDPADIVDIQAISSHKQTWSLAAGRLYTAFSKAVRSYNAMDGLFLYEPDHGTWIDCSASSTSYSQRSQLRTSICSQLETPEGYNQIKKWGELSVNEDDAVLLRVIYVHGCYIGAWINAKNIVENLQDGNASNISYISLCSESGTPVMHNEDLRDLHLDPIAASQHYVLGGPRHRWMIATQKSSRMPYYLAVFIRDNSILSGLSRFSVLLTLLSIVIIAVIVSLVLTMYRYLIRPINQLTAAMQDFQSGNHDVHVVEQNALDEFLDINTAFNQMVEQIDTLKIDVYEQMLSRQTLELQMLKQQIAPHTFINCLNAIHSLAGSGDTALVQQLAVGLSHHIRYLLSARQVVRLEDELIHTRNYANLCSIRYHDRITLVEDICVDALGASVPPLILQSFVENSIKYARGHDPLNRIWLHACLENKCLHLTLYDNGPGFSEEALAYLSDQRIEKSESGHRIGLLNLTRRLMLLYGEEHSQIRFENRPEGGASMEIIVPFCRMGEIEH